MSDSIDNFSGFWCSCEVVAATAQDTAEGAVVIAAGGAAGDPSEAAVQSGFSLGSCAVVKAAI